MSEMMIERVAAVMYLREMNRGSNEAVTIDVAVLPWQDLRDDYPPGAMGDPQFTKAFWRRAANAAIEAMREPARRGWFGNI